MAFSCYWSHFVFFCIFFSMINPTCFSSTKQMQKIRVIATLKNISKVNPFVQFTVKNVSGFDSILVKRAFCINLSNKVLMNFSHQFHDPVLISKCELNRRSTKNQRSSAKIMELTSKL